MQDDKTSNLFRNVLSFGDSLHERNALHVVTARMGNVFTKSIKFVERPSIEMLRHQLNVVGNYFMEFCHATNSLDLQLGLDYSSPVLDYNPLPSMHPSEMMEDDQGVLP